MVLFVRMYWNYWTDCLNVMEHSDIARANDITYGWLNEECACINQELVMFNKWMKCVWNVFVKCSC